MREFTVAVFVVHEERILLHRHKRLGLWLPPGGHIDEGELPDEAAIRETLEESGVRIQLVDGPLRLPAGHRVAPHEPARLCQPIGIQLEDIGPGHQHIDLIYAALPVSAEPEALVAEEGSSDLGWYGREDWVRLDVTGEVRGWAEAALAVVSSVSPRPPREGYLV
ncbi:MAG TPA: NUDIX domain-containing protein [Chloroflexota bacterium]|nr:NUDIX domain-containing protein [Chloroflexota bacterium]